MTRIQQFINADQCCEPNSETNVKSLEDDQLATMAKALGHPMRVKILRLLAERHECMTGDLVTLLPIAQSTVSEHLRILRDAGLIQGEIQGPRTSYCISSANLEALKTSVLSL